MRIYILSYYIAINIMYTLGIIKKNIYNNYECKFIEDSDLLEIIKNKTNFEHFNKIIA